MSEELECDLGTAVDDLLMSVDHVFGHLFDDGTSGRVTYMETNTDVVTNVTFDPSSLVLNRQSGPNVLNMVVTAYRLPDNEVPRG